MTTHYVDYTVALPAVQSGEIGHLLGRLWQRLHGILAAQAIHNLGVSLPQLHAKHPGSVLRLHSDADTLRQVIEQGALQQLVEVSDIHVGAILPVPTGCAYRAYSRNRHPEKYRDAWILRSEVRWLQRLEKSGKTISASELLERRKNLQERAAHAKPSGEVYIRLQSHSTHQTFSLLIEVSGVVKPCEGRFSHYGLAVTNDDGDQLATVPFW